MFSCRRVAVPVYSRGYNKTLILSLKHAVTTVPHASVHLPTVLTTVSSAVAQLEVHFLGIKDKEFFITVVYVTFSFGIFMKAE